MGVLLKDPVTENTKNNLKLSAFAFLYGREVEGFEDMFFRLAAWETRETTREDYSFLALPSKSCSVPIPEVFSLCYQGPMSKFFPTTNGCLDFFLTQVRKGA